MEPQPMELSAEQLLKYTKKHPHSFSLSSEAFSVANKDIVIHNIASKSDPDSQFDVANYRRGLTLLQEIIDFKQGPTRVARKGLRKFHDMMPEYLEVKNTHISNSKFHMQRKNAMMGPLRDMKTDEFTIYSTQKANGENAQISWDGEGGFWVIGSKNKTLLLCEEQDMKYIQHKHEQVRTLAIAAMWFGLLKSREAVMSEIKEVLSHNTLLGEYCDSLKSGHIIDYGKVPQLMFYSLVEKEEQQYSCCSPNKLIEFAGKVGLQENLVKFKIIKTKSYPAMIEEIRGEVFRISQASIEEEGEGVVMYLTAQENGQQHCHSVFKVKTLEYRIYRKLREKIRMYFEKVKRSYEKLYHKFVEEVKEMSRGFELPRLQHYYFQLAEKGFKLCEDQGKAVSKFVSYRFIAFLKILQAAPIDRPQFMKIVNESGENELNKFLESPSNDGQHDQQKSILNIDQAKQSAKEPPQEVEKQQSAKKHVLVIVPLTIPCSGKSTLFRQIQSISDQTKIHILSSDTIRYEVMCEKMKRQKNMSKKAAFDKSRKESNDRYYKKMQETFSAIAKDQQHQKFVFFLDKNHPENALKTTLTEIRQKCLPYAGMLSCKVFCLLPRCETYLENKPKFMYPFSSVYVAACLNRILRRQDHETLQGSELQRCNICINFANMFRNYALSEYNVAKHFEGMIDLQLHNEQIGIPKELESDMLTVLLGSKPGSFDQHAGLDRLVEQIKGWKYQEVNLQETAKESLNIFEALFSNFENVNHESHSQQN